MRAISKSASFEENLSVRSEDRVKDVEAKLRLVGLKEGQERARCVVHKSV